MVKKTKLYFFFIFMGILSFWKNKPFNLSQNLMIKQAQAAQKVSVFQGNVDFQVENTFENAYWYCS